jgi:CDP-paratose 2-epimerase
MTETILITGGCGFVGSNLAMKLKNNFPQNKIIALDNLKRRGSELNIARLQNAGIQFVHGDIRNKEDFEPLGEISVLIEAAAEPSVLSGIHSTPAYVLNTNLQGTVNCLEYALKNKAKFIFLSTGRVYPVSSLNKINYTEAATRFQLEKDQAVPGLSKNGIAESFSLQGARSFYGTSKLASEMLIQEYVEFYHLKAVINRCGVIAGPWQMGKIDQGVTVLWVARHFWKKELSYIGFGGKGKQVRDLLHVDDLYDLIVTQLNNFDEHNGQVFNVGGGNGISVSLRELTSLCEEVTGNRIRISSQPENRPADIPIYITDTAKISRLSNWVPKRDVKNILEDIFDWLKKNESTLKPFLN